jgi:hypothetical protein
MVPPEPPADLPDDVVTALQKSSDAQLRETIHYAQQLLGDLPQLTDAIEPREGERIIRMDDHGPATIVVVERPDASGEDRGPFAYRVRQEPDIDGGESKFRWHYLGKTVSDPDGGTP